MSDSLEPPPRPADFGANKGDKKTDRAIPRKPVLRRVIVMSAAATAAVASAAMWSTPIGAFLRDQSTAITAVATLLIAGFTCTLWLTTHGTLQHLEREFISTHRPKLHVRNVVAHRSRGPSGMGVPLAPGELVHGQLYVVNTGDTAATITESGCWVEWSRLPLPMERPYEGKEGNAFLGPGKLEPGQTRFGLFESEKPLATGDSALLLGDSGFNLWVMGWIQYRDDRMTPRRTSFCRRFTPGPPGFTELGHFGAVDNPDYEHEE